MRYRINAPHVIAETMGGETIIVHLATGCYFNLAGSAPEVWDALVSGETSEQILRRLEVAYDATSEALGTAVEQLVAELAAEELIVPDPDGEASSATAPPPAGGERKPFVAPSVAKFTDMQDIILLDPVHEVDARGWPYQQAGT